MKQIAFLLLLAFTLFSCKEHHETRISIKNDTPYDVLVSLSPKPNADGVKSQLQLEPEFWAVDIYSIAQEDYDPIKLLTDGYVSFTVEVDNAKKDRIGFAKNYEPNYKWNPFTDFDAWEYEEYYFTKHYNYSRDEILIHEFTFVISEDMIVREN